MKVLRIGVFNQMMRHLPTKKKSDLHENYSAKIDKDVIYLANRIKRKYELVENATNKSE